MFKKILALALLVASASFAQINFGAHVGLTGNTFYGDDAEDASTGAGVELGLAAKISLPMLPITIAPEVLFDLRTVTEEEGNYEISMTEYAVEIPVLIRLSLAPIIFVEAGPTFAFNMGVSVYDNDDHEIDLPDDYFNSLQVGAAVGVGTNILPLLDLDFRVNFDFTDFYKEGTDAAWLQVALGATYWF